MEVKIFVDVLFIINFIIDYILLSITSLFVKKSPGIIRLSISSGVGALFSAFAFFMPINSFFSLLSTVATAFLMVSISFGGRNASVLFKNIAIFYLVCISASGIAFGIVFSGKMQKIAVNNGIFYADINAYSLLFTFFVSIIIIHTATGYIKKQKIKSSFLYNVTIERKGKIICDTALFDTGNFTKDPISQKSVIIAEWKAIAPLFAETEITEAIVKNPKDFVYIGCRGFGSVTGMYAFSPDKVYSEEIDFSEPVLVAVCETRLDKDGVFRMILPNTSKIQSVKERI